MNYSELSDDEVWNRLATHGEAEWNALLKSEVIEPRDVLYFLDAFGDLSLAINCQGLPKDLPDRVIEEINGFDVLNDWEGDIHETECPLCNTEFYVFDWEHDYLHVSEYGDLHEYVEFISDPAGYWWDSTGEHSMMCQRCRDSPNFNRMRPEPESNSVRVFYGEDGTFSRFSYESRVIRWDFLWDMDYDRSTDLYGLLERDEDEHIEGEEIAAAFAAGWEERDPLMERLGFKRLHIKEIDESTGTGRKFWRYAKDVLSEWGTLDSYTMENEPTHPDLNFTYIIEGKYQVWVPEEHFEKFRAELVWQTLREAKSSRTSQFRADNDSLLSFDYYPEKA